MSSIEECYAPCSALGMIVQEATSSLFGDANVQMALSISALLPWLCMHHRHSDCRDVAAACIQVRLVLLHKGEAISKK